MDERRKQADNMEFAAMLADEHILSFVSLSAHIQPTEFYRLLLLSSSSVFQSAAAPGWTLKNTSTAASSGRYAPFSMTRQLTILLIVFLSLTVAYGQTDSIKQNKSDSVLINSARQLTLKNCPPDCYIPETLKPHLDSVADYLKRKKNETVQVSVCFRLKGLSYGYNPSMTLVSKTIDYLVSKGIQPDRLTGYSYPEKEAVGKYSKYYSLPFDDFLFYKILRKDYVNVTVVSLYGQTDTTSKRLVIVHANTLNPDGNFQKLVGNVVIREGILTFKCDTAYLDSKINSIIAKGNAIILKGTEIIFSTSNFLYNANRRTVTIDNKEIHIE